ncbi:MAG: DNA internalization-related competence protein ComEC/Rec2, partial [Gammaproteobacteria bacterium]|nr:DNA internalization-related competence protein ComEC/Rec2 [Gammaproteobacteria bacterium]
RGKPCNAGTTWEKDGWNYEFLHPVGRRAGSDNNSSCVLRISGFGTAVLLTGDIESEAEAALLARNAPLAADIVSLPHHGSLSSSTPQFVAAVSPRIAVASAGFGNRWNFPRDEVAARWKQAGAQVEVTGQGGAILLVYDGRDWHVRRSRENRPALWRSVGASVR